MIQLHHLDVDSPFPPVSEALDEPNGLLAYGADLSPQRLFTAYSNGIFPWFSEGEPLLWWSPTPRAIIELDEFICSKSLKKLAKQKKFRVTLNHSFEDVISACATIPRQSLTNSDVSAETWITQDMQLAYIQLHQLGIAHSVEVWDAEELVGGLYGVGIGKVFCGESMFHKKSNTSKLAMLALVQHMKQQGLSFIDCQLPTEHLSSLGAKSVGRNSFVQKVYDNNHTLDENGRLSKKYQSYWQAKDITP